MNKRVLIIFIFIITISSIVTMYYNKVYKIENDTVSIQSNIEKWLNRGYDEVIYTPKLLKIINMPKTNSYVAFFELVDNDYGYAELVKGINGKFKIKVSCMESGLGLIDYDVIDTGKINYVILYGKNQYKMIDHILIESSYEDYKFTADVANDEIFLRYDEVPDNIKYPYAVEYTYYDKNNNIIQSTKPINKQGNLQSHSASNLTINYIENKYQKAFVENKIDLLAWPLDDSIILNTIYENTVVNVIDTAEVNNVIWLYVSIHVYDTPSNYKGWIKESDTVIYTKDKINKVQGHVTVKDGEDIFETYNFEDISITEPYKSNSEGGKIEEKKDGFVRIQCAGGKTIWVKDSSVVYPEID